LITFCRRQVLLARPSRDCRRRHSGRLVARTGSYRWRRAPGPLTPRQLALLCGSRRLRCIGSWSDSARSSSRRGTGMDTVLSAAARRSRPRLPDRCPVQELPVRDGGPNPQAGRQLYRQVVRGMARHASPGPGRNVCARHHSDLPASARPEAPDALDARLGRQRRPRLSDSTRVLARSCRWPAVASAVWPPTCLRLPITARASSSSRAAAGWLWPCTTRGFAICCSTSATGVPAPACGPTRPSIWFLMKPRPRRC
jgi:hypothetical protein